MSLTPRQKQLLDYVVDYQKNKGFSPAYREIADHFEISIGNVHGHITRMEKRGYIKKLKGEGRSIEVLKTQVLAGALVP